MDEAHTISRLLDRWRQGDGAAFDELLPLVYEELRQVAGRHRSGGETLRPTALVHEAYMQLASETGVDWQDRSHFFAICARAMRRILVDYARQHNAKKRAGGRRPVPIDLVDVGVEGQADLVLAIDEALTSLEAFNERLARIVEYRYFAGLTEEETAQLFGSSLRTVQRDWTRARAWLLKELGGAAPAETSHG